MGVSWRWGHSLIMGSDSAHIRFSSHQIHMTSDSYQIHIRSDSDPQYASQFCQLPYQTTFEFRPKNWHKIWNELNLHTGSEIFPYLIVSTCQSWWQKITQNLMVFDAILNWFYREADTSGWVSLVVQVRCDIWVKAKPTTLPLTTLTTNQTGNKIYSVVAQ